MNKTELIQILREKADSLEAEAKPAEQEAKPLTRDDVVAIVKEAMGAKPESASESGTDGDQRAALEKAIANLLPDVGVPQKGNGLDRDAVAKMTPEQINANWDEVSKAITQ